VGSSPTPLAYCAGTWPAGPFAAPPGMPDVPGDLIAVRAVANLAAAVTTAREDRSWSRATLAHRAELAPHTVGRIEAGQTWPDVATIARLADALNLELALVPATPAGRQSGCSRPRDEPLALDLGGVDEPTAAHVIEAILHSSPRIAANVDTLRRKRSRRPPSAMSLG
jgi:transcriptional regulator with XRE-family HTH domain